MKGAYGTVKFVALKEVGNKDEAEYEARVLGIMRGAKHVVQPIAPENVPGFFMEAYASDLNRFAKEQLFNRPMPKRLPVVKHIMRRVLIGLAEVHKRGYVHVDIKTANVLLNLSRRTDEQSGKRVVHVDDVALTDFGSCLPIGTRVPLLACTVSMAAPEAIKEWPTVHPSMDVYSAGMMMMYLLTGVLSRGGGLTFVTEGVGLRMAKYIAWLTKKDPAERPTAQKALDRMPMPRR